MARLQQAETILGLVADVRVKLDSTLVGWARGNLDDMQAQLAALVPPGFLRDVPASALAGYPRYLKALATRAQRALNDPSRDRQHMLELRPFADALADASTAGRAEDRKSTRLNSSHQCDSRMPFSALHKKQKQK